MSRECSTTADHGFCVCIGSPAILPRRWAFPAVLILFTLARADGLSGEPGLQRYEFLLPRMGTVVRMVLYTTDLARAQKAATAAFDRLEELEERFSDYRDESELNRLTREAAGRPQAVSPELFEVLEQAQRFSQLSGGAFDITIGPLVRLWREARRAKRLPDAAQLAQATAAVGWRNLELDAQNRTVTLKRADMKLDLGGIAKGYAADQALAAVREHGIRRALIAAGGDIRVSGSPPGRSGWRIDIENPEPKGKKPLCNVQLRDAAISTSGDTQQFLEAGSERYSHIVSPVSGWGLRDAASTTVIARDGITADALATALSVMPVEQGIKLVESVKGASAFLVRRNGGRFEHFHSRGFPPVCGKPQEQE